jgi:hypothetical protein
MFDNVLHSIITVFRWCTVAVVVECTKQHDKVLFNVCAEDTNKLKRPCSSESGGGSMWMDGVKSSVMFERGGGGSAAADDMASHLSF